MTPLCLSLLELDVTDEDLIRLAAREFDQQSLDTLINVAGIYSNWDDKPFTELSPEDLVWHFKVNVVGPFLTSKYFLPALSRSKSGRIITCSSDMGSIADNIPGGNACYRISKSGVNQLTKTMALDLKKVAPDVLTLAVHPGFVATRMTGYHGEDDMDECMNGFVSIVERFGQKGDDLENGSYVRWNGERMNY
ncbi:MAG: hypothetical protein M1818_001356 [Claussenomyces sp. TS43310]|nr:MAG: hypothetical protein M1818_001356 [Claussenomyces sp. TS43310]